MPLYYDADRIRAFAFGYVVRSDPDAESITFTVGEIYDRLARQYQLQQVLGACTARSPLDRYGIIATQQAGFHANRNQEIRWDWTADRANRRYENLDDETRAIVDAGHRCALNQ